MTIYAHIFSTNTITNLTVTEFYFNQINPKTIQIKKQLTLFNNTSMI